MREASCSVWQPSGCYLVSTRPLLNPVRTAARRGVYVVASVHVDNRTRPVDTLQVGGMGRWDHSPMGSDNAANNAARASTGHTSRSR